MSRSVTTIVGLGVVTALFMAIMSMFYLQQIPTKADMDRLREDIRTEHGLYLSATAPVSVDLLRPQTEGERTGLSISCTFRADIRKQARTVDLYLARIADSILTHPDWRGRIAFVTIRHVGDPQATVTRHAGQQQASQKG